MVSKKEKYPVLPLRDIVVYPKMIVPLFVGRVVYSRFAGSGG